MLKVSPVTASVILVILYSVQDKAILFYPQTIAGQLLYT